MKVFCDIGNTYAKFLVIEKELMFKKVPKERCVEFLKRYSNCPVYISCVVEEIEKRIKKNFANFYFVTPKDLNCFKIKYNINQLGSDRAISAFAVKEMFGGNSLIISCGTAIVIDYINKKAEYVGGEIFPGISLLVESLYTSTSKLPKISISKLKVLKTKSFIGSSTEDCIVKGILNFVISGIKNVINTLKPKAIVITGGNKDVIKKYIKATNNNVYIVDQLVLLGLTLWAMKRNILNNTEISIISNLLKSLDMWENF